MSFFFTDTATTEIYTLSLHDALPIFEPAHAFSMVRPMSPKTRRARLFFTICRRMRSEEHTSELQSRQYLVCRLLLEKKKKQSLEIIDVSYSHQDDVASPLYDLIR